MRTSVAPRVTYSPELLQDLREFINLIPSIKIDELIAEYMIIDSGFRKAIKFLRSSEFKRLQQHAESLPEVIEVINFVHLNDTSIRSRMRFDVRLRQQLITHTFKSYGYEFIDVPAGNSISEGMIVVLLPLAPHEVEPPLNLDSFISFTRELLSQLPRDRFVELINEKRKGSRIFPKFYEAIRSDEFKPLLDKSMKSPNVQNIINTLGNHAIDAQSLKEIALEVISWGPTIQN
ncbi:GH21974 [Drosophila grimshawi]|uniref:GH21974 n=2 Tax=Drosophila grimshawi TaxID=7222 RepID=B4J8W5_DROGR|nr:GH21974 [Drosophila grimshawi]